jgi:hypothetical protein
MIELAFVLLSIPINSFDKSLADKGEYLSDVATLNPQSALQKVVYKNYIYE